MTKNSINFSTYFTEFYKQALYHFVVSGLCAALFALGLEYSKGSDRETDTPPYFMPAMVLSGIHFTLTVVAILAFYYARSLSQIYDGLRRWDHSEKHFRRLKPLYLLIHYPCFLWSIVGASIAGQTGICSTQERPCYYTVNKWQNRAVAIVIVVIHVLNGIFTFFVLTTRHKIKRDVIDDDDISRTKLKHQPPLITTPPYLNAKKKNQSKNTETGNKIKLSLVRDPQPPKKRVSSVGMKSVSGPKSRENGTNKREPLPPIKQPLKRHHTYDGQLGLTSSMDNLSQVNYQNKVDIKPLSPNKNKHKFLQTGRLIANLRVVAPRHRSASLIQPKNKPLYRDSDDSRPPSDVHPLSTKGFPVRRMTEHPRAPPPSYNEVIASSDTDPYWLPPLPQHAPSMHYLPENIYSSYSYPDTVLVPVHPVNVPKAQWQIVD